MNPKLHVILLRRIGVVQSILNYILDVFMTSSKNILQAIGKKIINSDKY